MTSNENRMIEARRWPKFVGAWKAAFKRLIAARAEAGKEPIRYGKTSDELFDWYTGQFQPDNSDDDQQCFRFED